MQRELPGRPDLVFCVFRPPRGVIFAHGCFWHCRIGCVTNRLPNTRRGFWRQELDGNVCRDRRNEEALEEMGWRVLVVLECETRNLDHLANVIKRIPGSRCQSVVSSKYLYYGRIVLMPVRYSGFDFMGG